MFELDRNSDVPLVDQIVERIAALIESGQLVEGTRIPSIRKLARLTGTSPFTVTESYDRLVARGLIEARTGRGFYVVRRPAFAALARIEAVPDPGTDAVALVRQAMSGARSLIPAGSGFLPPGWLMESVSTSVLSRLSQARRPQAWAPCPPQGLPELLEQLAARLVQRGIPAGTANLLTTSGASQAFDLIARALLAPGDAVLVEDPGYFVLFAQLRAHHARLVPVPRTAEGLDIEMLEELCRAHRPRAFFVQTLLHNPTGSSLPAPQCHRILSLAEQHGFAIVEDDVYGDLCEGPAVRLAQMDGLRNVIHVGSFSKLIGPAIRVGFVAGEAQLIAQLTERKLLSTLSGSSLLESVVATVLESGRYQKHLVDVRARLARARREARRALESVGVEFDDANGAGLFLWGRIGHGIDVDALVRQARSESILLARGSLFSAAERASGYLRFNAAYSSAPGLLDFLRRTLPQSG